MIELRPFDKLGHANRNWLNARHHFSFAGYHDPKRMGWGDLRVWNDDKIVPGTGLGTHSHESMEIITYVQEGVITHEDNMGNLGRTAAGDVQVMSAGSGIRHTEYNLGSKTTHLFQIWIKPARSGGRSAWGTKPFPKGDRAGRWVILASGMNGDKDVLPIRTQARVVGATLTPGESLDYHLDKTRHTYLVPAIGSIEVNGVVANARDGIAVYDEADLRVRAHSDAEIVLVDAN